MKRTLSIILSIILILTSSTLSAYADYQPPHKIWASFNKYAEALEKNDYQNIIQYGLIDISILLEEPVNDTTTNWLASRYQNLAIAYEKLENYNESANMYEKLIPYAEKVGWADSIKIANTKIKHYRNNFEVYTETNEEQCYFGAKNEPRMGVLYGMASDSDEDQKHCSMELIYLEYGDIRLDWIKSELTKANEKGVAVEFALNLPNEGNDIQKVINDNSYIYTVADMLDSFENIRYFVRFGAEFDVWGIRCEPEQYKKAFRKVADVIHSSVDNAAMVFSPNAVSDWETDMMDYYPGDKYVDWIGLSLYLNKYFQVKKCETDQDLINELFFHSGSGADPVLMLEKFIDNFGDKKPIMISESGASHRVIPLGEDTTSWAKKKLREIYGYLPVVYPQIKLIAHFDNYINNEKYDYSLKNNLEIRKFYHQLTSSDVFIKDKYDNKVNTAFKKLDEVIYTDGSPLKLYSYAHVYGHDDLTVNFFIDGKWVGSSNTVPYEKKLDMSAYSTGLHTMTIGVVANEAVVSTKTFGIIGTKNGKPDGINVTIDGSWVNFDEPPVIIDGRTLVPLRAIFEALGASVSWNDNTREAVAIKDGITVKIKIGSNILYKNDMGITLDVPAAIVGNRTMVPARAIAEAFGAEVGWNQKARTVIIKTTK